MRGGTIAIALAATAAAAPSHACELARIAELPVTMEGLRPLVPVKINDLETKLILDTGAFFSTVDASSAKRAGMKNTMPGFEVPTLGFGGSAILTAGRADTVMLADIPLKKVDFLIHQRPISPFAAGLLGQNVLRPFDVEYDLAHGAIRIFRPKGCAKANLAYWAAGQNLSVLPIRPTDIAQPHTRFSVQINGVTVGAMLDSGVSSSTLDTSAAARAGVRADSPGAKSYGIGSGIGRSLVEGWSAPFDKVKIGDEEIHNTRLTVAKFGDLNFQFLLGADFLLSHRVLVSTSQRQIYFTYNGGPVFHLPDPAVVATSARAAAPDPTAAPEAEIDAALLGRRAAASAARRDFPAAIRDYTAALVARPDDPELLRGRALAYLATKQKDPAARDLDRALKLDPGHVQSLLARGRVRLAQKDLAGAQADFEAALKGAPHELYLPLSVADQYARADAAERAIALYDAWIAAHPKDNFIAQAFNGRCWARTIWNRQLDLAAADCEAALHKARPNSETLNSRGVLRLRLGQLDAAIADFDASLRLQPNLAWSLYGRGLAKTRKGPAGSGDADLKAAVALDPDLTEEAARYGLAPT